MMRGIAAIKPGATTGDIGHAIQSFVEAQHNQLIADEVQQTGTIDHTPVYPREVVKRGLELSATAMILVHNQAAPSHTQFG